MEPSDILEENTLQKFEPSGNTVNVYFKDYNFFTVIKLSNRQLDKILRNIPFKISKIF